ncbi:MAG: segregation and condensation protein A [Dehalococcoidia bacterium]
MASDEAGRSATERKARQSAGLPNAHTLSSSTPFQLSLPGFNGPLELLLHLIEKEHLDITTVSLVQVADQYLSHLRRQDELDPVALADFIAIGARLLLLKSRSLLPQQPRVVEEGPPLEDELIVALHEYRRIREAAVSLRVRQEAPVRSFVRVADLPILRPSPPPLRPGSLDKLALLMRQVLARAVERPVVALPVQVISVAQQVDYLIAAVDKPGHVTFLNVSARCGSRLEIVVCFIALLHLVKSGTIEALQVEPFGDILLTRSPR